MDYTSFVKKYYTSVVTKLNRFSNYKGIFANLNYSPRIPKEDLHFIDTNFDGLPTFGVNINSDSSSFEEYLQYICDNTPDLSLLSLGKNGLKSFYEGEIFNEQDDEKSLEKIDLFIDIALDVLQKKEVIK